MVFFCLFWIEMLGPPLNFNEHNCLQLEKNDYSGSLNSKKFVVSSNYDSLHGYYRSSLFNEYSVELINTQYFMDSAQFQRANQKKMKLKNNRRIKSMNLFASRIKKTIFGRLHWLQSAPINNGFPPPLQSLRRARKSKSNTTNRFGNIVVHV